MAKKTVGAESLESYEGKLNKVYSANAMEGPFHIIDVVQAEDEEKIKGLCGNDAGFFIEDICNPDLILMRDLDAPVGLGCQECVTRREEILQAIVDWNKEKATKAAEKQAEEDNKKLAAKEREAKAKAKAEVEDDAKTPPPAEGEKKAASKSKGGKKKGGK